MIMGDGPVSYAVPIAIEIVGIIMTAIGVGIEMYHAADVGYVLISVGSVLIAAGSLLWGKILRGRRKR